MKKHFSLFFATCLLTAQVTLAQDCNCNAAGQTYLNKASAPATGEQKIGAEMGGNDYQSCSPCAQLAKFLCECECETSGHTRQEIEYQIESLGKTIAALRDQKVGNCCSEYANKKKSCPNAGKKKDNGSSESNNSSAPKSPTVAELNQDLVGFANMLLPFADNPEAAQTVKKLNNLHTGAQTAKDVLNAGGASGKALQTVDNLERVGQIATVFGGMNQPSAEAEQKWKEQDESKEYIKNLNALILQNYQKASVMPLQNAIDKTSLEAINAYEKQLNDYENNTAMQRLLVLRYKQYGEPPVISELAKIAREIKSKYEAAGLGEGSVDFLGHYQYTIGSIKYEIDNYTQPDPYRSSGSINHLMNSDRSPLGQELASLKSQYYTKQGDAVQAAKIAKRIEEQKNAEKKAKEERKKTRRMVATAIVVPVVVVGGLSTLLFKLLGVF